MVAPIQAAHSSVRSNLPSFGRHLRAENKAPATITTYAKAVDQLAAYLEAHDLPADVAAIRGERSAALRSASAWPHPSGSHVFYARY